MEKRATVRMNKAASGCKGLWWSEDTCRHPLASHSGKGRAQAAVCSSSGESWWGDLHILQFGLDGEGMRKGSFVSCRYGDL
jgi:hypothetical protein